MKIYMLCVLILLVGCAEVKTVTPNEIELEGSTGWNKGVGVDTTNTNAYGVLLRGRWKIKD